MADESYAIALLRQAGLREGVLQHEALAVVKLRPEDEEQHLAGEWVFAGVRRTEKQLILCFELLEDLKADDHVSDTDMRKTLTYTHVFQDHNPVSGETRIFYLYNYEVVDTPGQSLYYEYPEVADFHAYELDASCGELCGDESDYLYNQDSIVNYAQLLKQGRRIERTLDALLGCVLQAHDWVCLWRMQQAVEVVWEMGYPEAHLFLQEYFRNFLAENNVFKDGTDEAAMKAAEEMHATLVKHD